MKQVYAVKDLAVQAFGMPFFLRSDGEAIRSLTDEVNDKTGKSAIAAHPEDYELYQLGNYDEATGHLTEAQTGNFPNDLGPKLIARAKDLLIREQ